MNTILIDDEQDGIDILKMMLEAIPVDIEIVATCRSANSAIEAIQQHKPDLIFLDIEMPGKDGFEVLRAFDQPDFKVIVVTGYDQYAIQAIKFMAIDYLLKPYTQKELHLAVEKASKIIELEDTRIQELRSYLTQPNKDINRIIIPSRNGFRTIPISNIQYLESRSGNYCVFVLQDGSETIATKTLSYYEEILPQNSFMRIHRSTLVNLDKIKSFNKISGEVELGDGLSLPVAFRKRAEFKAAYSAFLDRTSRGKASS